MCECILNFEYPIFLCLYQKIQRPIIVENGDQAVNNSISAQASESLEYRACRRPLRKLQDDHQPSNRWGSMPRVPAAHCRKRKHQKTSSSVRKLNSAHKRGKGCASDTGVLQILCLPSMVTHRCGEHSGFCSSNLEFGFSGAGWCTNEYVQSW